MKRTITETVTKEVEFELPHYRTDNICHIYKVYSDSESIQVCYATDYYGISHRPNMISAFGNETIETTEEEFLLKFDEVYHNLLKL